jgi:hypothetical protein
MADQKPAQENPESVPSHDDADTRARVIRLAFTDDPRRYDQFVRVLRDAIPPDVSVILRGSAVTGTRWEDGAPFDADGPGTSDLDLTLIGGGMVEHFDTFYIPKLHSVPLSDEHPDASVTFMPLRRALGAIARRPVNIQATSDLVQYLRDIVMTQPYFVIIEKQDEAGGAGIAAE